MRYKYYSPVEPYATTIQAIKEMGPATYELVGKCSGMAVNCSMVLKAENFIVDGDFESGGVDTPWVVTNLSDTELSKKVNTGLYWAGIAKENVYSDGGSYSLGWWGQEEGVVKFEVSQSLEVPEDDTYKLGAVILTGQKVSDPIPEAKQNNYVAIEVNGEQAYKLQLVGGNYESGWIAYKLEGINLKTTDTVKIIIHVESSCLGYWGGIDALQLYR